MEGELKLELRGEGVRKNYRSGLFFPQQDVSDTKKSELDSRAFRPPPPHPEPQPHPPSAAPSVTGEVWRCLDFGHDVERQPVEVQPRWRRRQRRFRFTLSP